MTAQEWDAAAGRLPPQDALLRACERGDAALAQFALGEGACPERPTDRGYTPVWVAARHGRAEVLTLLLRLGARAGGVDSDGWTLLHTAAGGGCPECVRIVAAAGVCLDVADHLGATPLHVSALARAPLAVQALCELGAAPDLPDADGRTPLMIACGFSDAPDADAVRALLYRGADPNRREAAGLTPLSMCSRSSGRCSRGVADRLIAAGARAGVEDELGRTPLWYACTHCPLLVVSMLDAEWRHPGPGASLLLAPDGHGCTPLHACFRQGPCDPDAIVQAALCHGSVGPATLASALLAVHHLECPGLRCALWSPGARRALCAAVTGQGPVAGVSRDDASMAAAMACLAHIGMPLDGTGAPAPPPALVLLQRWSAGDADRCEAAVLALLRLGASPTRACAAAAHCYDREFTAGTSVLHAAARRPMLALGRWLAGAGLGEAWFAPDGHGYTPLQYAARNWPPEAVRGLLRGGDPDRGGEGASAFVEACRYGNSGVAQDLIDLSKEPDWGALSGAEALASLNVLLRRCARLHWTPLVVSGLAAPAPAPPRRRAGPGAP